MRLLTLTAVAVSIATAAPQAEAFSLSSISSLLSNYGVNVTLPDREINLPPRVEEVAARALGRAESVLDHVLGDGGVLDRLDIPDIDLSHVNLPDIDLPEINLPGFPEIELPDFSNPDLDAILDNARDRIAEARAKARERVDAALDKVADRIDSVRDRLEERFPDYEFPDYELPISLEGLIDEAHGVLDDILDDETPSVASLLSSESLPPVVAPTFQSASSSASYLTLPATASVAVPEPTSALLGAAGLLMAGVTRRR
ncbi:hypothetical protein [Botrimarina mediterranea]|uniref:PEP-CTERM protein-sorting domain-containing protein n=1 Tax=Botrimarina mediterranea TaxID=2528022 RepID=A0A518KEQ9_9BACT|nr:hypothetical protein [Botrimarina mediterranea]QDV76262.1 hypothetical protein Spa11_44920 [Botrimarina mediterranea]